jgi:hypothetical protein
MRNVIFYRLTLCVIILIAACKPTPTPIATVVSDCAWDGTAVAWRDANSNGIWDKNEMALTNAIFQVDGWDEWWVDNAYASKDVPGGVGIFVWLAGCPDVAFQVCVEVPENYRPTTNICMMPKQNYGEILQFGLND